VSVKPRIVRESAVGGARGTLGECWTGLAGVFFYWPEDCPYTPEQVMAACERDGRTLLAVPERDDQRIWLIYAPKGRGKWFTALTSEFIGEPKRCEHGIAVASCEGGGWIVGPTCPKCGAILSDRRHGERRKGEQRKVGYRYGGGGRRYPQCDRRTGKDRRTP